MQFLMISRPKSSLGSEEGFQSFKQWLLVIYVHYFCLVSGNHSGAKKVKVVEMGVHDSLKGVAGKFIKKFSFKNEIYL